MKKWANKKLEIKEIVMITALFLVITTILIILTNLDKQTITGLITDVDNISPNNSQNYIPGELIIKYKDNVVRNGNEIIINNGTEILIYEYLEKPVSSEKIIPDKELYNLKFDNNNINDIINNYKNISEIEYVEPNYLFEILVVPDDSNYSQQYGLKNIIAEEAWNLTVGNKKVIIAFIDTGVEWTHEDLFNNIWNNSDEGCDENFDLDNNSYKGDCRGYDFVDITSQCKDSDCSEEDNNPSDDYGHGTHVTGIASASSNNNLGIAGVCWNCSIMPIRAGYKYKSGIGVLTLDDVVQALHYATDNNATIISMSFGGSHSVTLQEAINYSSKNILIASAGNSGSLSKQYPCVYENVICVASTNSNNESTGHSNYGEWVDLSAPGSSILSTYLNNDYKSLSGTSMSTPMVAGVIGLIKSLYDINQTEIKNALNNTGTTINFKGTGISMVNVYSAILSLDNIKPNITLIYPENNAVNLTLNQTFSCEARDWQIKNLTLQIWDSTNDLFYSESRDISGIFNSSSFNVLLNEDFYKWGCLSYDSQNNYGFAINFSLLTIKTSVSLISPLNDTHTNENEINFNCSVQAEPMKNLENITFLLGNSSDLIYTRSTNISGTVNSSIFSYNFNYDGDYLWTCKSYNNNSELITTNNFTITYDFTPPKINLLKPENNQSYDINNQEVTFSFNVNDLSKIGRCDLIINNVNLTNSSVDKSLNQEFKNTFTTGNYEWNISCIDKAGNIANSETRSFRVNQESSEEGKREESKEEGGVSESISSSEGEGKGKGGSEKASIEIENPKKTLFISNKQFSEGYTKELNKKDEIKFFFKDEKIFGHSLTINEITNDFIEITVQSEPINLKLGIGEEKKLNLANPTNYDFYVKLNSINNNKADITIQLINEEIASENLPNQKRLTGFSVDEDKIEGNETGISKILGFVTKSLKLKSGKSYLTYLIILISIMIIITIMFFFRKKHKNERVKITEN